MNDQNFLEILRVTRKETIEKWGSKRANIKLILHCIFVKINPTGKDSVENKGHSGSLTT